MTDSSNSSLGERVDLGKAAQLGVYAAAALLGFWAGARGLHSESVSASTPSSRVGWALSQDNVKASRKAWEALASDLDQVRKSLPGTERQVFDLIIALRGLDSAGVTDWAEAERLCRGLNWTRCDRTALEELKKRSRP